jgi:NAD(P)-dependent dehydrogenase (short-subunit alcohol dehydrogenase family)
MSFHERLLRDTQQARAGLLGAPIIQGCLRGEVSLPSYLAFLSEAYHHVRHTVPLLKACKARCRRTRPGCSGPLDEYIEEEAGHDEWILDDIAACGADAEAVRHGRPAPATEVMVAYAYDTIARGNPLGFFGMVHVLEGTSVSLALMAADAHPEAARPARPRVQLPALARHPGPRAHGPLRAADGRHHDPQDQADIVHAARMFYRLYGAVFREPAAAWACRRWRHEDRQARVLLTGATGGIGQAMAEAPAGQPLDAAVATRGSMPLAGPNPARRGWCGSADLLRADGRAAALAAAAALAPQCGGARRRACPASAAAVHGCRQGMAAGAQTNLLAPMLLTQALLPHLLRAQPQAQVMFVGSALGRIGLPGFSAYSASKAGLRGFAEALRRELADSPVRVQYLGPAAPHRLQRARASRPTTSATGTAMRPAGARGPTLMALLESEALPSASSVSPKRWRVRSTAARAGLAGRQLQDPSPKPGRFAIHLNRVP